MKKAKLLIQPATVSSIKYLNTFKIKPGENLRLTIKNGFAVNVDLEKPLEARVVARFDAVSEDEAKSVAFSMEAQTIVVSSTYIDDLEDVIKKDYLGIIWLNVLEKVKAVATLAGLNVTFPPVGLEYIIPENNENPLDKLLNE